MTCARRTRSNCSGSRNMRCPVPFHQKSHTSGPDLSLLWSDPMTSLSSGQKERLYVTSNISFSHVIVV